MAHQDALRFSYFQQVRRENPHEYYTNKTQAQMARAYKEQGSLFFDIRGALALNIFKALEAASLRLQTNDPTFDSQANLCTDILRTAGVYPHRRSSLNGHVHKLLSAAIVHVYQQDTSLDVTTRRAGTFALYGYSTKLPSYLTKAVKLGFLTSQNGKATGKLELSELLLAYLDEDQAVLA